MLLGHDYSSHVNPWTLYDVPDDAEGFIASGSADVLINIEKIILSFNTPPSRWITLLAGYWNDTLSGSPSADFFVRFNKGIYDEYTTNFLHNGSLNTITILPMECPPLTLVEISLLNRTDNGTTRSVSLTLSGFSTKRRMT